MSQDSDRKLEAELGIVRRLLALSLIDGKKQRGQKGIDVGVVPPGFGS